jgi:ABC transporter DrrB family efflux protein
MSARIMFPFITMFLVTSIAMLRERTTGTLERLMTMPLAKLDLLGGYGIAFALLATMQALITSAFAYLVLGFDSAGAPALIVLLAVIDAVLGSALGLLASAFAKSEFQAVQFMPAFVLPQILLCGLLVPRDQMAGWLDAIASVLPLTFAFDALDAVALDGADVTGVVAVLRRGVDAADGTGRTLFCGLRSLGWPEHPVGQLWRACDLLRQHRGDGHTAACIAAGLDGVTMNVLTELWLGMPVGRLAVGQRGWPEDAVAGALAALERRGLAAGGALTTAGRQLRDAIEEQTDAMQQPVIDAIGDDLDAAVTSLDAWSARCIAAGLYTPDIYKRATS